MIDNELGALYFPPGRYRLNNTLTIRHRTGYHLVGCGMAQRVPFGGAGKGCESVLVWGGTAGGTMVQYEGQGLVWNGLGLWGCNWPGSSSSCPGSRAGTGILIKRSSASDPLSTGKTWFGSLLVEDLAAGVASDPDTDNIADEISFGFFWPKGCDTAVHLQDSKSVNYSFEYIHAEDCDRVFKVTNGGRIFTQAMRVLTDGTIVLDLLGGDATNAFYHINGLALDDGVDNVSLLENASMSGGTHHVRYTNAHLVCSDTSPCPPSSSSGVSANCHPVSVNIDRTNSADGQTMLEFVGCRGLAALDSNVVINGDSSTHKSHLIVRESEIARAGFLIDTGGSSHYTYAGFENWTYGCGIVPDDSGSG
jgi:hypothetical protein